jgi:hypothetical protein
MTFSHRPMPVILATQEAEIRRIKVWAKSFGDPISTKPIKKRASSVLK